MRGHVKRRKDMYVVYWFLYDDVDVISFSIFLETNAWFIHSASVRPRTNKLCIPLGWLNDERRVERRDEIRLDNHTTPPKPNETFFSFLFW